MKASLTSRLSQVAVETCIGGLFVVVGDNRGAVHVFKVSQLVACCCFYNHRCISDPCVLIFLNLEMFTALLLDDKEGGMLSRIYAGTREDDRHIPLFHQRYAAPRCVRLVHG